MTIQIQQTYKQVKNWKSLPIFLIVLLGILLRLIYIKNRGIWYDDAFSILLSGRSITEIIPGTAADTMPPIYYFLLHYWEIISKQIWFLRLLNVLLSSLTIYMVFRFVKFVGGLGGGLLAAFLSAISPFQIYHAQEIRMYVILELALVTHFYFFVRLFVGTGQNQHGKFWIGGLILSGVIALYSHNLAIFTLAALDIFLLFKKQWKNLIRYVLYQCLMGIFFLPWLIFLPGQIEKIQTAFWTPRPGLVEIIQAILSLFGTLPLGTVGIYSITIAIALVIVTLVLLTPKSFTRRTEIQLIISLIFIPPILLFLASWLMRPIFVPRAFIVSGLMAYALSGIILSGPEGKQNEQGMESKSVRGAKGLSIFGICSLILVSVISLPYQYTYNSFPRSDYKKLMEIAGKDCGVGCVIIHDNKLSYFPSFVYDDQPNQVFIADEPGSHNDTLAAASQKSMDIFAKSDIQEASGNNQEIRLVVFSKAIEEYKQAGIDIHPKINWLNENYHFLKHDAIGDIELFYYSKP